MITGTVYRATKRDAYGDPVDDDGNVVKPGPVGEITGLIFGGQSVESVNTRGHVVSTEGLVGVPAGSPVQLRQGDHLVVDDIKYQVDGPRLWTHPHSLTGTPRRYTWVKVKALHN